MFYILHPFDYDRGGYLYITQMRKLQNERFGDSSSTTQAKTHMQSCSTLERIFLLKQVRLNLCLLIC